jgi:hypothetical protein
LPTIPHLYQLLQFLVCLVILVVSRPPPGNCLVHSCSLILSKLRRSVGISRSRPTKDRWTRTAWEISKRSARTSAIVQSLANPRSSSSRPVSLDRDLTSLEDASFVFLTEDRQKQSIIFTSNRDHFHQRYPQRPSCPHQDHGSCDRLLAITFACSRYPDSKAPVKYHR